MKVLNSKGSNGVSVGKGQYVAVGNLMESMPKEWLEDESILQETEDGMLSLVRFMGVQFLTVYKEDWEYSESLILEKDIEHLLDSLEWTAHQKDKFMEEILYEVRYNLLEDNVVFSLPKGYKGDEELISLLREDNEINQVLYFKEPTTVEVTENGANKTYMLTTKMNYPFK